MFGKQFECNTHNFMHYAFFAFSHSCSVIAIVSLSQNLSLQLTTIATTKSTSTHSYDNKSYCTSKDYSSYQTRLFTTTSLLLQVIIALIFVKYLNITSLTSHYVQLFFLSFKVLSSILKIIKIKQKLFIFHL